MIKLWKIFRQNLLNIERKVFFLCEKKLFCWLEKIFVRKKFATRKKKSFGKILFWWKTEMWVEMNVDRTNSWWFGKRWELCERWVKERKRLRWLDDQRIGEFRLRTREKCTDTVSTMLTATHLLKKGHVGSLVIVFVWWLVIFASTDSVFAK